jgi:hypothetical protein
MKNTENTTLSEAAAIWWATIWPVDIILIVLCLLLYILTVYNVTSEKSFAYHFLDIPLLIPVLFSLSFVLRIPNRHFKNFQVLITNSTDIGIQGTYQSRLSIPQMLQILWAVFWRITLVIYISMVVLMPLSVVAIWQIARSTTDDPSDGGVIGFYGLFIGAGIAYEASFVLAHVLGVRVVRKIINRNISGVCLRVVGEQKI